MLAVVALVALRLGIGWQFYMEGVDKTRNKNFSSAGFLGAAKGPLAGFFKSMQADPDGLARLDAKLAKQAWKDYRDAAAEHFEFDNDDDLMAVRKKLNQQRDAAKDAEKKKQIAKEISQLNRRIEKVRLQSKDSEAILKQQNELLDSFLAEHAADIREYKQGLERRKRIRSDAARVEVSTMRAQTEKIEGDLAKDRAKLMTKIDAMWDVYERAIWNLLSPEQQEKHGPLRLQRPGEVLTGVGWIDGAVPYSPVQVVNRILPCFDMAIGALLILGLFTRTTSVVGALFLASVVATQWPGSLGAAPTYYQFTLMLALLVLAATGAGRFGGLDFFIGFFIKKIRSRCCPPKRQTTQDTSDESNA